jgi:hypothetical protein
MEKTGTYIFLKNNYFADSHNKFPQLYGKNNTKIALTKF